MSFPHTNRTYQIFSKAKAEGYAIGGYCVYNAEGVLAVIRAAERCRSPALIQVFPWTMHNQGLPFVKFIVEAAHSASVPIAVHLDHCIQPADVELALTFPFDSIMVDGSLFSEEENSKYVRDIVKRAAEKNITIEAEIGRMEGCEDGLPDLGLDEILTSPDTVAHFIEETGIHFLAPSFGNVHGPYPPGGAEKWWQVDRLAGIHKAIPDIPLVLHGTHPLSDEMVKLSMTMGMVKINQNRTVRENYMKFIGDNSSKLELTKLQEQGVEIYSREVERFMGVAGSVGKA
ncbi:hypothetical protein I302_102690 [Kwoniella bestiolae CBS 10118]|uniref:Fructose-bisphosphate aldolase n=1 Tax=Kwoniella bestiolae CBS 10118 TaxID=1296100 RepID=A0A1B9GFP3_9TREE|nr:hypothetical protein I302_01383 [Kwoniella bestiolae CBS 10118]OCF29870.1 hypothetical protein I302_01383 [Kwoniella bestiolae CBS 10118]